MRGHHLPPGVVAQAQWPVASHGGCSSCCAGRVSSCFGRHCRGGLEVGEGAQAFAARMFFARTAAGSKRSSTAGEGEAEAGLGGDEFLAPRAPWVPWL